MTEENRLTIESLYMTKEISEMFNAGQEYEKRRHKCPKQKVIVKTKIKTILQKQEIKRYGILSGEIMLNKKFTTKREAEDFASYNSIGKSSMYRIIKFYLD